MLGLIRTNRSVDVEVSNEAGESRICSHTFCQTMPSFWRLIIRDFSDLVPGKQLSRRSYCMGETLFREIM